VKTDPTFWLLARASGLTAYALLTASVLAGLVLKSRPFGRALRAASVTDVHRFLALLGLGMLGLHGVALLLDATVKLALRRRIGARNWRRLHWATYLVFLLGTVHGLAAGSDSAQPWARGLYLGAVGAVAFATAWRALTRPTRPAPTPVRERST
jgi:sulfoxide reductase heme-binding subunit YedZ